MADVYPPGTRVCSTYNCDMSDSSEHVDLRDRSPAYVTVVELMEPEPGWEASTRAERDEAAMPFVYTIKFDDGFKHDAFEDELTRVIPGLASVHIDGLVHGIQYESLGHATFCGVYLSRNAPEVKTLRRREEMEEATCLICLFIPRGL